MNSHPQHLAIGEWTLDLADGRLHGRDTTVELEPKTLELLALLARHRGQVMSREALLDQVWPDTTVSFGALARCISKCRKALGDNAQAPRFIETLPKRGYRLLDTQPTMTQSPPAPFPVRQTLASVVLILLVTAASAVFHEPAKFQRKDHHLLGRADDFYYQYTRTDNESAMALYERVLGETPNSAPATLGLANTLVQTVVRWPEAIGAGVAEAPTLQNALSTRRTHLPRARSMLQRAESLAVRAVRLDAGNPKAHRTLGLVHAALKRFDEAHRAYDRALELDPLAWGTLINQAELFGIQGHPDKALELLERAYAAMTESYNQNPVHIRPWYPELGHTIGAGHAALGRVDDAEAWYRRVLDHTPFHIETTIALAKVLHAAGDHQKAGELYRNLTTRTGSLAVSASGLPGNSPN